MEVATALVQTEPSSASVRPISGSPVHEKDRVYPPGHPANNSMGAERVPAVRIKGAIASSWIESGNESASDSDSDSSSDVVVRRRDGSVVLAADMSEVSASPASKAKKVSERRVNRKGYGKEASRK